VEGTTGKGGSLLGKTLFLSLLEETEMGPERRRSRKKVRSLEMEGKVTTSSRNPTQEG